MKLVIHDLEKKDFEELFPKELEDSMIFSNDGTIHPCIGCFGCWTKTPSTCIIRDNYADMGKHLSKCSELIIISKCCYGGYSPFVKNVIDRSIPYIHPYFVIRNGEMHHRRRYDHSFDIKVYLYGKSLSKKDKAIATRLVKANSMNFYGKTHSISFFKSITELEGQVL